MADISISLLGSLRFEYVVLPDEINLKKPELADRYAAVSVEVSGREPGTHITKTGAPMVYGITIPGNAPNPELAVRFVAFLLDGSKGLAIMERNGQPSLVPSPTDTYDRLPEELKGYALPVKCCGLWRTPPCRREGWNPSI